MADGSELEDDVLRLLSEAWQVGRSEGEWLEGIVGAAEPILRPDMGIIAAIATASRASSSDLRIVPCARGMPDSLFGIVDELVTFSRADNQMRRNFASHAPVMTFSDFSCYARLREILESSGLRDVAVLFTGPLFGTSLAVAAGYRERRYFSPRERRLLGAAAAQLSVALDSHRIAHRRSERELALVLQPGHESIETRCVELLSLGLETKELAQAIGISFDAARKHISNSMKRHGVSTREALLERLRSGGDSSSRDDL
ncbi:MAG: response regulator transcription factor [Labilithrix sp.]|nr:response regulator transcription factor [Labilithrix sp.]MCW5815076.1 response regulator transcription factor [Labilithrix sp.]